MSSIEKTEGTSSLEAELEKSSLCGNEADLAVNKEKADKYKEEGNEAFKRNAYILIFEIMINFLFDFRSKTRSKFCQSH